MLYFLSSNFWAISRKLIEKQSTKNYSETNNKMKKRGQAIIPSHFSISPIIWSAIPSTSELHQLVAGYMGLEEQGTGSRNTGKSGMREFDFKRHI
tara:strand:+ start:269 stop:553 length:285 start_codon:yes stop_codon:yes gene_type:complete